MKRLTSAPEHTPSPDMPEDGQAATRVEWAAEARLAVTAGLVYFVGARIGLYFVMEPEKLALIWPSAGVLLGFLLTTRRSSWPFLAAATFGVVALSNATAGQSVWASLGFAAANTSESLAAAWVVRRVLGHEPRLDTSRDVAVFVGGAVIASNAVTALLGASVVYLNSGAGVWRTWLWWWIEDGMGMLLVGPVVVGVRQAWTSGWRGAVELRTADIGAMAALVASAVWVFLLPVDSSYSFLARPYVPLPIMFFLALRSGPWGAMIANAVVAVAALVGLPAGVGAFMTFAAGAAERALGAQMFLGVACATTLIAAAVSSERTRAVAELVTRESQLLAAEKEAREQRRRLQEVIWGTNIGTWEWNIRTGETSFNERWAEIAGYSLAELEPTSIDTWKQLAHPDDLQRSNALLAEYFAGRLETYDCEVRMKHRNGHWVWVLDRGRVVEWSDEHEPVRMSGTHQDITDQVRSRQQMEAMAREKAAVLDTAPVGIMSLVERKIVWCNDACGRLVGSTPAEMIGTETARYWADRHEWEEMGRNNYTLLARGDVVEGEVRLRTRTGGLVVCSYTGRYIDHRHPERGAIWALVDITARKEAEQRLSALADSQRTLLREVNHRVKNNLAAILGIVHMEQDLAEAAQQPLAARVMLQLESRLRALSNVHNMLSKAEWGPIRLDELCRRIVTEAVQTGLTKGPSVRVAESSMFMDSDRAHSLALAMGELATNTLKYGKGADGTVTIDVTFESADDQLGICYRDRGPGYPAAILASVSTGRVGLELLRGIVEHNLRGRLELSNDGGAVTVLRFPIASRHGA